MLGQRLPGARPLVGRVACSNRLSPSVHACLYVFVCWQVERLQRKVADLESSLASKEQAAKQVSHESAR
jgi:hypothetical protein